MLEEKLEQAHQQKTGRNRKIRIALVVFGAFFGILIIGLSSLDFSKQREQTVVTNSTAPAAPAAPTASEDTDENRDAFTKALAQYEHDFEILFFENGIENWNETAFREMKEMKQAAISLFGTGKYRQATQHMQLLQEKAAITVEEAQHSFDENFQKAFSFLNNDRYDEARFHIDQALLTAPQSSEAAAVKLQIEQLPALLPLLNEAETARLEKNLQKEHDYLKQVIQISPKRDKQARRLKEVAEVLTRQQFEEQIAAGFTAVRSGKATKARDHFQKAKNIAAGRKELSILMREIASLEKSITIENALARAKSDVRRDDWQNAKVNFGKVLAEAPGNTTAQNGLIKADQILRLHDNFDQFFAAPYRLADSKVKRAAMNILTSAKTTSQYSYSIKTKTDQLELLLTKLSRNISVLITSDTKTHILIRGVGKVGVVAQKEIHLRPGRYTFEGTRDDYKSKLLHVLIPYDKDIFTLFITCDEPI